MDLMQANIKQAKHDHSEAVVHGKQKNTKEQSSGTGDRSLFVARLFFLHMV